MNKNFSNKKTLLTIVAILIIVTLVLIGIAIRVFYPQKTDVPEKELPRLTSLVKEECLENFSKMSEDEFLANINDKNFKIPENSTLSEINAKIVPIYETIINYLICKVEFSKDENFYNKAKDLVGSMNIQEENKQGALDRLNKTYSKDQSFNYLLASGDLWTICPKVLPDLCLSLPDDSFTDFETRGRLKTNWCRNICETIVKNKEQPEKFIDGAIINQNWQTDVKPLRNQYEWRAAMAYRIQGMSLAEKVCEQLPIDDEKERCLGFIASLGAQNCNNIAEKISTLICQ